MQAKRIAACKTFLKGIFLVQNLSQMLRHMWAERISMYRIAWQPTLSRIPADLVQRAAFLACLKSYPHLPDLY